MPDILDSEMQTYASYRPTGFDPPGLAATRMGHDEDDTDRSAWLVALGQNRDSGTAARSNFRVALRSLETVDPDGKDHEIHRFGHWACGWLEIIIVRPGTAAHQDAWETECALANYPILDEMDWSELESEEQEDEPEEEDEE
jgi:hypothetical protein